MRAHAIGDVAVDDDDDDDDDARVGIVARGRIDRGARVEALRRCAF